MDNRCMSYFYLLFETLQHIQYHSTYFICFHLFKKTCIFMTSYQTITIMLLCSFIKQVTTNRDVYGSYLFNYFKCDAIRRFTG